MKKREKKEKKEKIKEIREGDKIIEIDEEQKGMKSRNEVNGDVEQMNKK